MNHPNKRAATMRSSKAPMRDQWQPTGPCRFQQLPLALVMDILSRLTPNNLFTCRCVCKPWLFMISNPHFNRFRHSRSPMGILIQTYPHNHNWKSRKLDFIHIVECAGPDLQLERMSFRPKVSIPLIGNITNPMMKYGLINTCNGLLLLSGPKNHKYMYVCNPILGEFIATPPLNTGFKHSSYVGLGFSAVTNEYKVVINSVSDRAEIYTVGTGVWRDIGNAPYDPMGSPFNAFLHGTLHWATQFFYGESGHEFMYSFNFETEKFGIVPPPSHFASVFKCKERLTLGVFEGCLLLCVFDDDPSKFEMWIMRDYGVQESWIKIFVVENFYPRRHMYVPMMFLSNGEILMSYGFGAVVCYNPETKSFREISIAPAGLAYVATGYNPSFVSLKHIAKGEEVESVRDNDNFAKLFCKGSSSACSGKPPHKSTNLNPGYCAPAVQEALPRPRILTSSIASSKLNPGYCAPAVQEALPRPSILTSSIVSSKLNPGYCPPAVQAGLLPCSRSKTSSASSHEQMGFTWRIRSECAICGGQLGYVFRGKGFATCQQCFDASSS